MHTTLARTALLVCSLAVLPAVSASAQPKPQPPTQKPPAAAARQPGASRFHFTISAGGQLTTTDFEDSFTFELHQETGTSQVRYPIESGFLFDIGGGARVWRQLGVGVAISRFSRDGTVTASSSVPHPFFFQRHREISGEDDGIARGETGVHVQAQYSLPLRGKLQLMLMAGPSFQQVNQDLVSDVNYSEQFPFDTATFLGVDAEEATGSGVGFNVGADVRWMFSRQVGAGVLLRFTRTTVDLDGPDNRTVSVDAGGAHIGAGIRLVF